MLSFVFPNLFYILNVSFSGLINFSGKRKLIFLLSITFNFEVSVWMFPLPLCALEAPLFSCSLPGSYITVCHLRRWTKIGQQSKLSI